MKQSLKQSQKLSLKLTANLGNQIKLLSLSGFQISSKLNELIEEYCDEEDKKISYFKEEYLADKYRNAIYPKEDEYRNIRSSDEKGDLRVALLEQLELESLNQIQMMVGEFIIDSVRNDGRLESDFDYEDIKKIIDEDFGVIISDVEIESVLKIIQNLDPPGCAYRNISESLMVQIENLDIKTEEKDGLKLNLKKLLDDQLTIGDLPSSMQDNFSKLSLNPAGGYGEVFRNYVRPDLIAIHEKESWHVTLNDEFLSKELIDMVTEKVESVKAKDTIVSKSFLKGLERRQQTLLLVAEYIVEAQGAFLDGKAGKRAISNKEIADKLLINPSTVSRIVKNKYIQFPDKVLSLNKLLERRINKRNEGKDVTIEDLKYLIGKVINSEDKVNPLSDQKVTEELKNTLGIILSRRTVAKYRSNLNIPSSRKRQVI